MNHGGRFGWAVVLLYAVCAALRLARFNTALDDDARPAWSFNYFTGVPAPAGAGMAIMPLIASFEVGPGWFDHPWLIGAWTILVSALMVSRIPTFAFKRLRVPHWMVLPVLLAVGTIAAGLAAEPWITLLGIGAVYIVSIPLAWRNTARLRNAAPAEPVPPAYGQPTKPADSGPPGPLVSISGGRSEPR
jgi:CDP-diacylglycerol--serine O-phosphatidyltransferase